MFSVPARTAVFSALFLAAVGLVGCGRAAKAEGLRIAPSEASRVSFVTYQDPSGWFSLDIPRGWSVKTGLKPDGKIDLISYAVTVFDPAHPERELYFCLNSAIGLKSREAHDWHVRSYGPASLFAQMPVLPSLDTTGFFGAMGPLFGYSDFSVLETAGRSPLGGEVVVATCTSRVGKRLKGLYHAVVTSSPYFVAVNPFNPAGGQVDVAVATEFTILSETAGEAEFFDWQPVLARCLSSLVFSDSFHQTRRAAWAQLMGTTAYVAQSGAEIGEMIADSYRKRETTGDVLSQKRSDATLGWERVQDTETGEYYRAENGFSDWYDGSRYRPASENAAYLAPLAGDIRWK